jgi:transposase InsO family protein
VLCTVSVNAVAESFFSSLKKEHVKKKIYRDRSIAHAAIAEYIEAFHNPTRRHSHLGQFPDSGPKPSLVNVRFAVPKPATAWIDC